MPPSYRALFLIAAVLSVLHVPLLDILIILLGYMIFEWLDERVASKAKQRRLANLDEIIFGWKPRKDELDQEEKGQVTRVKLTGQNEIVTARIADLLREIV